MKSASLTLANSHDCRSWILAARPKTLVAGFAPVFVATALAFPQHNVGVFLACLLGAICFQLASNFVNDAADFQKGADTHERKGPPRAAQLGLLTPKALYLGSAFVLVIACLIGIYLVKIGGWPIFLIGLLSIFSAIAYTAGPFPLGYYGLGDLFVFLFFGLAAVLGTFYLHTSYVNLESIIIATAVGLHSVALIAINNTRDIDTDIAAGKLTLATRLKEKNSKIYYYFCLFLPFFLILGSTIYYRKWYVILILLLLPMFLKLAFFVRRAKSSSEYIIALEKTGKAQLAFSLLLSIGLWLSV